MCRLITKISKELTSTKNVKNNIINNNDNNNNSRFADFRQIFDSLQKIK